MTDRWQEHVYTALFEQFMTFENAVILQEATWVYDELNDAYEMRHYNEALLGPLDMADLEARATEIMNRVADPLSATLTAAQFEAGLFLLGIDREQVEPAIIQAITDPTEQAKAIGRWRRLVSMTRDNGVMAVLKGAFNVTDAQIDDMWQQVQA